MKLASRGKRFGGYLLDRLPLWIIVGILMGSASYSVFDSFNHDYYSSYGSSYSGSGLGGVAVFIVVLAAIAYIVLECYFFSRSQTIGKAILGMRVISSIDGKPIGFWKMLLREVIVKLASSSVFCLGYIWILIDDKNRGWHDKILDTYVIDIKDSEAIASGRDQYGHPYGGYSGSPYGGAPNGNGPQNYRSPEGANSRTWNGPSAGPQQQPASQQNVRQQPQQQTYDMPQGRSYVNGGVNGGNVEVKASDDPIERPRAYTITAADLVESRKNGGRQETAPQQHETGTQYTRPASEVGQFSQPVHSQETESPTEELPKVSTEISADEAAAPEVQEAPEARMEKDAPVNGEQDYGATENNGDDVQ